MGELLQVYRLSIGAGGVLHDANGLELHVSILPLDPLMLIGSIRHNSNLWHRQLCQLPDNRRQPSVDLHADRYRNLNANGHPHVNVNGHPNLNRHLYIDANRHPDLNGHPHLNRHPHVNANGHPLTDADIYSNGNAYTNAEAGQWHLLLNRDPVQLGFLRRWDLLWLALVPGRPGLY